jgi:hypothetical protein
MMSQRRSTPEYDSLQKRILCKKGITASNRNMIRNLDIALLRTFIALLRTFVAVVDQVSMSAAGIALCLTQSAVSQQIARLENTFGPVFVREHRRIRLTVAGERLLPKARRLLALNDEIWHDSKPSVLRAPVRFGAPQDLTATWLAPILKSFAQACPLVEVTLICMASSDLVRVQDKVPCIIVTKPACNFLRGGVPWRLIPGHFPQAHGLSLVCAPSGSPGMGEHQPFAGNCCERTT